MALDENTDFFDELEEEHQAVVEGAETDEGQESPGAEEAADDEVAELDDEEAKQAEAKAVTSAPAEDSNDDNEEKKLAILDDPYIAEQCTTRVTIVIAPEDGHEFGPMVFLSATTHEEMPGELLTCRFKEVQWPPKILEAIAHAHGSLPARAAAKQAAEEEAERKRAETKEKEQQRKQKKQVLAKKEAEKKKIEEKRQNEPKIMDMFAALEQ